MTGFAMPWPVLILRTPGRISTAAPMEDTWMVRRASLETSASGCGDWAAPPTSAVAVTWIAGSSTVTRSSRTSRVMSPSTLTRRVTDRSPIA